MKQFRFLVYGKDERQRCLKEILENRGHVAKNAEESSAGFLMPFCCRAGDRDFFWKDQRGARAGQDCFRRKFRAECGVSGERKKDHGRGLHESGRGGGKKRRCPSRKGSLRRRSAP